MLRLFYDAISYSALILINCLGNIHIFERKMLFDIYCTLHAYDYHFLIRPLFVNIIIVLLEMSQERYQSLPGLCTVDEDSPGDPNLGNHQGALLEDQVGLLHNCLEIFGLHLLCLVVMLSV